MDKVILYLKFLYGLLAILIGIVFLVWLWYENKYKYTFNGVQLADHALLKKAKRVYSWWLRLVASYWVVFVLTHFLIGWRQWNQPL